MGLSLEDCLKCGLFVITVSWMLIGELHSLSAGPCIPRHMPTQCDAMSWDGRSRAAWVLSRRLEPALAEACLEIVKTPRGPEGAYGRMLTMTQFFCPLARKAAMVQKMVCDSQFHLHTSCMILGESVIWFKLQFPSLWNGSYNFMVFLLSVDDDT